MKCPDCGLENDTRSVCKNCGKFLYSINPRNRYKPTKAEKRKTRNSNIILLIKRTLLITGVLLLVFIVVTLIAYAIGLLEHNLNNDLLS